MAKYLFFKGETLYYSCLARVMWEGAETLKDNILLALTILLFTKNFNSAVFVFQSDVQTILMTKNYTHTHTSLGLLPSLFSIIIIASHLRSNIQMCF